jgi:hypothetical protein
LAIGIDRFGESKAVEEHFASTELQVRQEVFRRNEPHDAVVLLAGGIMHQQGRGILHRESRSQ